MNFAFLERCVSGDQALVREVLLVFAAEAMEWAPRLDIGSDQWRAVVHTMKGTSRTIGADALGDLCEGAEEDGGASLPLVRSSLEDVLGQIGDYLAASV